MSGWVGEIERRKSPVISGQTEKENPQGLDPSVMANRVVAAIREDRFYILAEDEWRDACEVRLDDIREARNPTFSPPG
jgi:hypothetical protein